MIGHISYESKLSNPMNICTCDLLCYTFHAKSLLFFLYGVFFGIFLSTLVYVLPLVILISVVNISSDALLQPLTTMCMKADYTTPVDSVTSTEQTDGAIEEPAIAALANEEINTEQEVVPQQKSAKIHDFCLGIPFGMISILF
jgi:hypothetical protein